MVAVLVAGLALGREWGARLVGVGAGDGHRIEPLGEIRDITAEEVAEALAQVQAP